MPRLRRDDNPFLAPLDFGVLASGWYVRTGPDELSRYRRWHVLRDVDPSGIRTRCGRRRTLDWIDDIAPPETRPTQLLWISGWDRDPLTIGLGPPWCQACLPG